MRKNKGYCKCGCHIADENQNAGNHGGENPNNLPAADANDLTDLFKHLDVVLQATNNVNPADESKAAPGGENIASSIAAIAQFRANHSNRLKKEKDPGSAVRAALQEKRAADTELAKASLAVERTSLKVKSLESQLAAERSANAQALEQKSDASARATEAASKLDEATKISQLSYPNTDEVRSEIDRAAAEHQRASATIEAEIAAAQQAVLELINRKKQLDDEVVENERKRARVQAHVNGVSDARAVNGGVELDTGHTRGDASMGNGGPPAASATEVDSESRADRQEWPVE